MTLLARCWAWLTQRLLGTDTVGTHAGYLVLDAGTDPQTIADILDLPAYRDPVETMRSLEDERGRIYLWECSDDGKADALLRQFDEAGASGWDALHLVVADETELRELDRQDLEPYIGRVE